jgi:hypothetical protein
MKALQINPRVLTGSFSRPMANIARSLQCESLDAEIGHWKLLDPPGHIGTFKRLRRSLTQKYLCPLQDPSL